MEDYERTNAREWDLNYKEPAPQSSESEWQVVGKPKKREPPDPALKTSHAQVQRSKQRSPLKYLPQHQHQHQHQQHQHQAGLTQRSRWNTGDTGNSPIQARRPPPKIQLNSDNDAEAAWRARAQPVDEVSIPEDFALQGNYHEQIAREHGAFIFSRHAGGVHGFKTFQMWGDEQAVAQAKHAIRAWVAEVRSSLNRNRAGRSLRFAKMVSLTVPLREREERRWVRQVKRQKYRQQPPPDMKFGAIGNFHWPVQEYRPEEILGASCEALDEIRMDCSLYVVLWKERNVIRLMGTASGVQEGLQRLRRTCFQVAARQIRPLRTYSLRWPDVENVPAQVCWRQYEHPALLSSQDEGRKPSRSLCGGKYAQDAERAQRARTQTYLSTEHVRSSILKTLKRLHYYRGSIQLRVRLGTFLAIQYKEPEAGLFTLDEYESMIKESQFTGEVTQELGSRATELALLSTLQRATYLITPSDPMATELTDVKPLYTATLSFFDPTGPLRLAIEWQAVHDVSGHGKPAYERVAEKWTRLDRDTGAPTPILDLSLTDLRRGMAWQFDLLAAQLVDEARLPPHLVAFAHSLSIDPAAASPDGFFVRFYPFAHLRSVRQSVAYRFTLVASDVKLELARVQDRQYPSPSSTAYAGSGSGDERGASSGSAAGGPMTTPRIYEPRWGISMYRTEWDTMFSQNERLAVGAMARWGVDEEEWWAEDVGEEISKKKEQAEAEEKAEAEAEAEVTTEAKMEVNKGWEQFVAKLGKVEELVETARAEAERDLIGGMRGGKVRA